MYIKKYLEFLINENNISKNLNFLKWFRNSKTIVNNNPTIYYHGTMKKFDFFDKNKQIDGYHGKGFYFYNDKNVCKETYGKFIEVYLRIEQPFNIWEDRFTLDEIKNFLGKEYFLNKDEIEDEYDISFDSKIPAYILYPKIDNNILIKHGYDGIIHGNVAIVFEPNQIKSIKNDGSFDLNDDNIYS